MQLKLALRYQALNPLLLQYVMAGHHFTYTCIEVHSNTLKMHVPVA